MGPVEVQRGERSGAEPSPRSSTGPFAYQPALDGVRAVAVVLVLLFHAGFGWMGGGYVGVSVFFTLSGFLITSLLITEHRRTLEVDVESFFARRLRRLLPASIVCLAGIGVASSAGAFDTGPALRSQFIGAAADVYNWTQIASGDTYGSTFAASPAHLSPLEHYWSLAIEEQFYLLWPFVMVALLTWSRSRRSIAGALVALFMVSAALAVVFAGWFGGDFAYWSTVTRLPELLAGAALGGCVMTWRVPSWLGRLALPALSTVIACAVLFPPDSGPAYSGTMSVFALASVLLLAGLQADSPVRRVLSAPVLVRLGTISYGVYLFHWPIFVWVRQQGGDLTSPVVFGSVCGVVIGIAAVSAALVERPIRRWDAPPRLVIVTSIAAVAATIALIVVAPFPRGLLEPDDDALARASADPTGGATGLATSDEEPSVVAAPPAVDPPSEPTPATSVPSSQTTAVTTATTASGSPAETDVALPPPGARPARILTVGDSTAFYVGQAFAQWTLDHPDHSRSDLVWCQGCGLILDGTITSWVADSFVEQSGRIYRDLLPEKIARVDPDAVVMMTTVNDVTNRQWNEQEGVLTPLDSEYRERMLASYRAVAATLDDSDAPLVLWVKPPVPIWAGIEPEMTEVVRWEVMGEIIDQVAAEYPDTMTVVDADAWMHAAGRADSTDFRPDGTHLTEESAYEMVDRWLAPTVLGAVLSDIDPPT